MARTARSWVTIAVIAALALTVCGTGTGTDAVARGGEFQFVSPGGQTKIFYDPPGRSLLALQGYPRSVVPSTIVLDRQHRVAAVFLAALRDTDLLPTVARIAAEPTTPAGRVRPTTTGVGR